MITLAVHGEMSERFKELVLKTSDPATGRGFESHSLRHPFNTVSRLIVSLYNFNHGEVLKW